MDIILVEKLQKNSSQYDKKQVSVAGWVKSVRSNGSVGFIDFTDGTCFKGLQIVIDGSLDNYEVVEKLNAGSSIVCTGEFVLTPQNKQPYELHATNIQVVSATEADYPLQKKRHSPEYLREIAYLRPRANTYQAVFRVRSVAAMAIHTYFQEHNFLYVHTPLITCADCEGSDQMFKISALNFDNPPLDKDGKIDFSKDLFGRKAYITGSGQLHGEAFAMAFNKIYTFGPTFRTENSNTKIHANEFWMIEPEMAFCDLEGDMVVAEEMIKYIIGEVLENAKEEIEFFNQFFDKGLKERLNHIYTSDFAHVTYTEAVELLEKVNDKFEYKVEWGTDLQTEHERYLTEEIFKKPVFVTDYPKEIKAFYMKLNDDNKTVRAVDLLVPGIGEIIGGSQREENLEKLQTRMKELGLNEEDYSWYLDTRRYGTCVHSGFGLGFERLVMYMTGIPNIRDVIPFPRTPGNCLY